MILKTETSVVTLNWVKVIQLFITDFNETLTEERKGY